MLNRIVSSVISGLAAFSMLAFSPLAHAQAQTQAWPTKPVRLIVPFPPGGGTDAFARPLAARLSLLLGQQFIIDSRGGAGGNIGADLAAKSAPDGYTFLVGTPSLTTMQALYPKLNFDPKKT